MCGSTQQQGLPVGIGQIQAVLYQVAADAPLVQLGANAQRPKALATALIDVGLDESPVAEQTAMLQAVENLVYGIAVAEARNEFASEFVAGVLACSEDRDRRHLDGGALVIGLQRS